MHRIHESQAVALFGGQKRLLKKALPSAGEIEQPGGRGEYFIGLDKNGYYTVRRPKLAVGQVWESTDTGNRWKILEITPSEINARCDHIKVLRLGADSPFVGEYCFARASFEPQTMQLIEA